MSVQKHRRAWTFRKFRENMFFGENQTDFFWNTELSPLAVSFPEGARPWKSMKINVFKAKKAKVYKMYTTLIIPIIYI